MCRTGCPTQDHANWGACARSARLQIDKYGIAHGAEQKVVDTELNAYRNARHEGMQPDGTSMAAVRKAVAISDHTGVAYQAGQ